MAHAAIRSATSPPGGGTSERPVDPEPAAIGWGDCTEAPPVPEPALGRGHRQRQWRVEFAETPVDGATARAVALEVELGRLEDRVAATGWTWDAALSGRVDTLRLALEEHRG